MTLQTTFLADGSEIVVVHYLVQPRFGKPHLACIPTMQDFGRTVSGGAPIMRTDECRSVTCPLCKRTEAHKKALEGVPR